MKNGVVTDLAGFGKFVVKNRAARTSINPRTKQAISVPASKAPTFRAGKQFKERFINYSYTGQTMTTEDGDELVTGEKSKDKIVIIYTLID